MLLGDLQKALQFSLEGQVLYKDKFMDQIGFF